MNTASALSRLALGAALAAVFIGCPKVPDADPLPVAPRIVSFTGSAAEVALGAPVTLRWNVENADTVKIEELRLGLLSGVEGNSGEVEVAISGESLFVLTARNARGLSDTSVVSVRVTNSTQADLLFSALPNEIEAGGEVTLAWAALGAGSATITAAPGGTLDLGGQGETGTVTVKPTANTTYTLSAGSRTATASVTIRPTILAFEASPLSADAGSDVTLSWQTVNATRVQVTAPGRGTLVDETNAARVAQGSLMDTLPAQVDPGQLFAYRLTVTAPNSVVLTRDVVVSVKGNPAVQTFTVPKYVSTSGDAGVPLAWTTREADSVSIAIDGVEIYRAPPTAVVAGSVVVPRPAADATFTLTASEARGGSATSTASIELVGAPTVTATVSPNPARAGEPVTIGWSGTDVRNVRITTSQAGEIFRGANTMDTGTVPGTSSFGNDVVITVEADNGAGQFTTARATLAITDQLQLSIDGGSVVAGQPFTLNWSPAVEITGLPHADVVTRTGSTGFDDISSTGTAVAVTADGTASFQPQNFTAPFFGSVVGRDVWVSSDGFMSFNPVGFSNYSAVAVPSSKLEPLSIAPCWSDITTTNLRWQVKDLTDGRVLIVQWDQRFQVKVFTTGQVDIEYGTLTLSCANRGVRGRFGDSGFAFTPTVANNLGLTLFGPKTGSATLTLRHDAPVSGSYPTATGRTTFSRLVGPVIQPRDLFISEALVNPAPALGENGQWFELYNTTATAIDLTGWRLASTDGGAAGTLSGTIAPNSVLVIGQSNDGALNDDAGVQLVLSGYHPGLDAGVANLAYASTLNTFSWSNAPVGTALVNDVGPFKFSTDTSSSLARAQVCNATAAFGSQTPSQLGTPGAPSHCGFPYSLDEMPVGYFDISGFGTKHTFSSLDTANVTVPLTGAPFPYFGTARTQLRVSTNGFVAFDSSTSSSLTTNEYPSTTDPNAALAILGGDLVGHAASNSGIYTARVGPNVDPYAAAPHWIIQWKRWAMYSSTPSDDLNFEIKLFDDGTIEYHYDTMLNTGSTRGAAGVSVNTWIENPAGTQALVVNTRSFTPGISPFTAYRFSPR